MRNLAELSLTQVGGPSPLVLRQPHLPLSELETGLAVGTPLQGGPQSEARFAR